MLGRSAYSCLSLFDGNSLPHCSSKRAKHSTIQYIAGWKPKQVDTSLVERQILSWLSSSTNPFTIHWVMCFTLDIRRNSWRSLKAVLIVFVCFWPLEGSRRSWNHNNDILSTHKVDMLNTFTYSCLFYESSRNWAPLAFRLVLRFCRPDEYKSNIQSTLSSVFVSINSWGKYQVL